MKSARRTVLLACVLTAVALLVVVLILLQVPGVRSWAAQHLQEPSRPLQGDAFELREVLLDQRDREVRSGDVEDAAEINAQLSQEALLRSLAVHKAWLGRRDPTTHLYAQSEERPEWNYRNTAADFFGFHLHAGLRLNPSAMDSLKQTLRAESALRTSGGLCQPVLARSGQNIKVDQEELVFGSSEYIKDGLLSVYERYGNGLVGETIVSVVDAIIRESRHPSKSGVLPGRGTEVNGNMLQVCGRMSYALGREDYAEFAARIAEAMVRQALPANGGLLPMEYDYSADKVIDATVKLRDHGNEAVLGLAEVYAMAVARSAEPRWQARAGEWAEPLARLFETVLTHGVDGGGRLVVSMRVSPPGPSTDKITDNWGYVLCGTLLFTEAARRHGKLDALRLAKLEARVDQVARAVFARLPATAWGGSMDSDADAVESAIYLAALRPALRGEALGWADRQIDMMFARQRSDGIVDDHYLDGNFIRTSLMYADARSGGWRVEPWREDVSVGFADDGRGRTALVVSCLEPYSGRLVPDQPRHRSIMKLPWNWPRLNSWPEWPPAEGMTVTEASGVQASVGAAPPEGFRVELPANGSARILLQLKL
jgi:hypothetical protein